ncbi:MAG TPA: phosphatidylglycerophosphatase A [Ignavibacteria bacterium]|nr:phosphatidylglycerophosphatase A [Ignavibacteria bacterium]HMQ99995.1 phosphatidylglycerophosphatase A [Ignavibacteria bacterium]
MAFRLIKEKNPINDEVKVPLVITLLGSGFFVGFIPVASGTFGSLIGLGLYLAPKMSEFYYLSLLLLLVFIIGIFCAEKMKGRYGEDPPQVIIDEIAGQLFTYLVGSIVFEIFFPFKSFDPATAFDTKLVFGIIGFFSFRFFDIIKLEPAKYFDNKDSGFGIMMDDIAAGLYAGILSAVLTHLAWYQFLRVYLG